MCRTAAAAWRAFARGAGPPLVAREADAARRAEVHHTNWTLLSLQQVTGLNYLALNLGDEHPVLEQGGVGEVNAVLGCTRGSGAQAGERRGLSGGRGGAARGRAPARMNF